LYIFCFLLTNFCTYTLHANDLRLIRRLRLLSFL
jgi:hypothetical protein